MANRNNVYIGNRYVPVFANPVEWDNLRIYEPLTIVTYQGTSYTSKKAVPAGIALSNTEYWVATGNYNAQVEQYSEQVAQYATQVEEFKTELEGEMQQISSSVDTLSGKFPITNSDIANNAVDISKMNAPARRSVRENSITMTKKVVMVGDSYVHLPNKPSFDVVLPTIATNWDCHIYGDNGAAFSFPGADGHTFTDLVNIAYTDLGDEASDIDYLILCGGRNEAGGVDSDRRPVSNLDALVEAWCLNAHTKFPNTKIIVFPCLYDWKLPNPNLMKVYEIMTQVCRVNNVSVATGCFSWGVGDIELYNYPNDIHPNQDGSIMMCKMIYDAVQNNNMNCFRTRQDNCGDFGFYLDDGGISIHGEHTFDGATNLIVAKTDLPKWLRYNRFEWWFAGRYTNVATTEAVMCGLDQYGLNMAGTVVIPANYVYRCAVKLPFTL